MAALSEVIRAFADLLQPGSNSLRDISLEQVAVYRPIEQHRHDHPAIRKPATSLAALR
jgi:hypothetical protein